MEAAQDELAYYFSKMCKKYNISGDVHNNTAKFIKLIHNMHNNWLELDVPFTKTIKSMRYLYNNLNNDYKNFIDAQERIKGDEIKLCMETAIFLKSRDDLDEPDDSSDSSDEENLPKFLNTTIAFDTYYYVVRIRNTTLCGLDMLPNVKLFDSFDDAQKYIGKYASNTVTENSFLYGAKFGKYGENIIEMSKVKISD